jgi:hypothetical protein
MCLHFSYPDSIRTRARRFLRCIPSQVCFEPLTRTTHWQRERTDIRTKHTVQCTETATLWSTTAHFQRRDQSGSTAAEACCSPAATVALRVLGSGFSHSPAWFSIDRRYLPVAISGVRSRQQPAPAHRQCPRGPVRRRCGLMLHLLFSLTEALTPWHQGSALRVPALYS